MGEIAAHSCIVRAFGNDMLCAIYSSRIAVRPRLLLLRHAVPSARLLRQPVQTSAPLCQSLPPAALTVACKVWFTAMRADANAASYIVYTDFGLGLGLGFIVRRNNSENPKPKPKPKG